MRFVLLILAMAMSVTGRSPPDKDEQVIVVGAGLAGLSATIELLEAGNKVVLVDGEKNVGGNSAKATSGVSAYGTDVQERLGINDSRELFYQDTVSAGDRENDETLVGVLVDDSASAIEFLTENGANLSDINLCGGHSVPRTHWFPSPKEGRPTPVGIGIIRALKAKIDELVAANPEQLNLMLETKVLGLVSWNEYIVGVRAKLSDGQIKEITGKAVVLASGGFSADRDQQASLLLEFAPDKVRFPTTNGGFARGDGVKMARAMGAAVVGMERVQIHPTAFIDPADPDHQTKFLAAEALRGKGAILLNRKGDRFGNELGRRDYLTGKIMGSSDGFPKSFQGGSGAHVASILLMTDETADDFGRPAFNFYANIKKFFTKYENAEALAKALEIEPSHLEKTLTDYNKLKTGEAKKDQFGKKVFPAEFPTDKPLYAALITPALHYTMGGLKIDRRAQVFNEYMKAPFKGLFAAGEVAGGVHGSNRLAGNSLLECVVFGRIAGRSASVVDYSGDKSIYHADRTEF